MAQYKKYGKSTNLVYTLSTLLAVSLLCVLGLLTLLVQTRPAPAEEAPPPQEGRSRDSARVKARILFLIKISPFQNAISCQKYVFIVPQWGIPVNGSVPFISSLL